MMKLLFSRNPNPRLAVAAARFLGVDLLYEYASPFAPGQADRYRPLNPTLRLPILVSGDVSLWEADAIACRLSKVAGSPFWRLGDDEPEMIQWLSWGKENFVRACDMVHFERGTKQRYALGAIDESAVAAGLAKFEESAAILDAALHSQEWLLGGTVSYADFRMATFLPFNDVAGLPLDAYGSIARWYRQLEEIAPWRDPFDGLDAPALPAIPARASA